MTPYKRLNYLIWIIWLFVFVLAVGYAADAGFERIKDNDLVTMTIEVIMMPASLLLVGISMAFPKHHGIRASAASLATVTIIFTVSWMLKFVAHDSFGNMPAVFGFTLIPQVIFLILYFRNTGQSKSS